MRRLGALGPGLARPQASFGQWGGTALGSRCAVVSEKTLALLSFIEPAFVVSKLR